MSTIIKNARMFNVYTSKWQNKMIRIENGLFTEIENNLEIKSDDQIIDAKKRKMIPGLIDIHMHVESSMTTPDNFEKLAMKWGTTTVVADPHEIANVFGLEGICAFMDTKTQLDIFYGIPSSVPSTRPELETTGGIIGIEEVKRLLLHPKVRCLGEVMNLKDLTAKEKTLIKQIVACCRQENPWLPIEGHCPKISGTTLDSFLTAGVDADHTQQTPQSIEEKVEKGMFLEIQRKSITPENIRKIMEMDIAHRIAIVTDDTMPDRLLHGHVDVNVRKCIEYGMPLEKAIQCATINPALRMGFADRGAIAPGKLADFIFLKEDALFEADEVYKNGNRFIAEARETKKFDDRFRHSIIRTPLTVKDLCIPCKNQSALLCNVMEIDKTSNYTYLRQQMVPTENGELAWWKAELNLIICAERYGKSNRLAFGLVKKPLNRGAVATSWAHDHHNLMSMGTNKEDILKGINYLIEIQGGIAVVENEAVSAVLELPVGGIVSDVPIEEVAVRLKKVREEMTRLGYEHVDNIMSFATLSLPVSPEIKITDRGYLVGTTLEILPLIAED